MTNSNHGAHRTRSLGPQCGRLGKSTRFERRTFVVTRIVTSEPGCRE